MYTAEKTRLSRLNTQAAYKEAAICTERGAQSVWVRAWATTMISDDIFIRDQIIAKDPSGDVIEAGIEVIRDWNVILDIAKNFPRLVARRCALRKLGDAMDRGENLDFCIEEEITNIAISDKDFNMKQDAIRLLSDKWRLKKVARYVSDPELRRMAIEKIPNDEEDILFALYKNETDAKIRRTIIDMTSSTLIIKHAAMSDKDESNQCRAIQRANDFGMQDVIEWVAVLSPSSVARHTAIAFATCPIVREKVLLSDPVIGVRQRAIQGPQSQEVLTKIALDINEPMALRRPAIMLLESIEDLKMLRRHSNPKEIRDAAAHRISELRVEEDED